MTVLPDEVTDGILTVLLRNIDTAETDDTILRALSEAAWFIDHSMTAEQARAHVVADRIVTHPIYGGIQFWQELAERMMEHRYYSSYLLRVRADWGYIVKKFLAGKVPYEEYN